MAFESVRSRLRGVGNIISDANPEFAQLATPAEREAIAIAQQNAGKTFEEVTAKPELAKVAKDLGLKKKIRAKYKIEVFFGPGRTTRGPNLCGIQIFESGRRAHGGGDDLMFWCKDSRPGHNEGCWAPIVSDNVRGGQAFCKSCQKVSHADLLTSLRILKLPTLKIANSVADIFRQLDTDADIYLKYSEDDVHFRAMAMAKGLHVAKTYKGMHIYTLDRILQDTAAGADLNKRFFAFLTS